MRVRKQFGLLPMPPIILWFRRNLRLRDNAPLAAAVASGRPIIPVYISDAEDQGGASRWWLHHSLVSLDQSLREHGGRLVFRRGEPVAILQDLVDQTGATAIYFARRYEPAARQQEQALESQLSDASDIETFDDSLLNHPTTVLTKSGTPFKVFTPFWRSASSVGEPPAPEPAPANMTWAEHPVPSDQLADLDLLPTQSDWSGGLVEAWTPGEAGAHARLDALEDPVRHYAEMRDRPDIDGTSQLSPHLHFGEVSVRQVWHSLRTVQAQGQAEAGAEALLRQLYWRDFSTYLLYHFPDLPHTPLRPEFAAFPWSDNAEHLSAWQQGRTGYPIVDAGMRQLWTTGWMHNRVRMIVASFLIKDLLIPWQKGAAWFLDTLVDADLANNSASWQWVAGCGTDAAPYFRIFNPTLQGEKFDPDGDYVRRWIPELDGDYPSPIVDHRLARDKALAGYRQIREHNG